MARRLTQDWRSARLGLALAVSLASCADLSEGLDERIDVGPDGRLEVDLHFGEGLRPDPGSLEVAAHEGSEVRMLSQVSGWGAGGVELRAERNGSTVRLLGSVGGALSWLFGGPNVQVRIWVPRGFALDLRASAGPIRVDEVGGSVRARTGTGQIEVAGARGAVKLRASEGDVRVSDAVRDVRIRASAGDIELSWVEGAVEARTGEGSIDASHIRGPISLRSDAGEIELSAVAGPVEAKTESGAVFVSFAEAPAGVLETRDGPVEAVLPAEAGLELDAEARDGSVELAGGLELDGEREEGRAAGRVGAGGPPLRLYTARGGIRVSRY